MKPGKAAAIAVCAIASLALTACGSNSGSSQNSSTAKSSSSESATSASSAANSGEKGRDVHVVASTTQICDYVTQIAKDNSPTAKLSFVKTDPAGKTTHYGASKDKAQSELDLTCLLAPNASAHEHEMTPQQISALGKADLFLVSGVDLEHFLDKAVEASGFKGTMVVTSGVLTADEVTDMDGELAKEKNLPYKVYRGVEKVHVRKWPFPPAPGEKEPEFKYDPHVWTSPVNAKVQVTNIGAALDKASPSNKALFDEHVARFQKRLDELNHWAKESLDTVPKEHRVLFTSHDAFGYFSKLYDVDFIGTALTDFNNQADATADHIQAEAEKVKASGARALFAENSNNPKSIEAIANAAGVKAIIGDDALYGDSLGPVGSDGETYIGSILHNVENLVIAWDGKVAPLPADLQQFAPKQLANSK